MAKPPRPGNDPGPTNKFIQIVGVEASLYALDNSGVVFKFNRERDSWFPMSMEVVKE